MARKDKLPAKVAMAANIILAGAGVACLLVLSYFAYHYGWTGRRQFTSWAGVLLYYVFPAVLGVLFFASLRLRPVRKINLALFICSAAASIYALEILLTLWFSLPSVIEGEARKQLAKAAKAAGIEFDSRSKRQVILDLIGQGIDAVPSFPRPLLQRDSAGSMKSIINIDAVEILPLAGMANKLVVVCNETGQFLTYRSDQYGFHNPPGLWDGGPVDVVAVGDSFVQGFCVPPENNFIAVIRKRYPRTLNLGIEGNGPLVMLAGIKEYAEIVKPKVVLWFYFEGNDIADLRRERNSPLLRSYLTDRFRQGLPARQAEIDRALDEIIKTARDKNPLLAKVEEIVAHIDRLPAKTGNIMKISQLRERLGLIHGTSGDQTQSAEPKPALDSYRRDIELLSTTLTRAKEIVGRWGGTLYFVYLPVYYRYSPEQQDIARDRVLQAAGNAGLPIVDIHRTFMNHKDPLSLFVYRLPSHYNEEGNRLVGEEVLRSISVGR